MVNDIHNTTPFKNDLNSGILYGLPVPGNGLSPLSLKADPLIKHFETQSSIPNAAQTERTTLLALSPLPAFAVERSAEHFELESTLAT